jgi:hypothetical protein
MALTVSATDSKGTTSAYASLLGPVSQAEAALLATAQPTIAGDALEATTLTASPGQFTGTAPFLHAYQWKRCDDQGSACSDVGTGGTTYALTIADVGFTIRVADTASNPGGSATTTSDQTAVVEHTTPPTNAVAPFITGALEEGATITADPGMWDGTQPIEYTYVWQRCQLDGTGCAAIAGQTEATYLLVAADAHKRVRVLVHAHSAFGDGDAQSLTSSEVAPARAPVNSGAPPSISGTYEQTQQLTASEGEWTGTTASLAWQWYQCDAFGAGCTPIVLATTDTYTLTAADIGKTIRVQATKTNPAAPGGVPAMSAETGIIIAGRAPILVQAPGIRLDVDSESLVPSSSTDPDGKWDGTMPMTFQYEWQHCTSTLTGSCSTWLARPGQSTFPLTDDTYVGGYFRVVVYAYNALVPDDASAPSAASNMVAALSPCGGCSGCGCYNVVRPTFTGDLTETRPLEGNKGSWVSYKPLDYAYQWQRCDGPDENTASCADITDATGSGYTSVVADVGSWLRLRVIASNVWGTSAPAYSLIQGPIAPAQVPVNTSLPVITGADGVVGTQLTVGTDSWTGTADITVGYVWRRCDSSGGNCADITDAMASTYTLLAADIGSTIVAVATAANQKGTGLPATSARWPSAGVVLAATPVSNTLAPSIVSSGDPDPPAVGNDLSVDTGTWNGTLPLAFTYQWQRCDSGGLNCVDIDAATNQTYHVAPVDFGARLQVTMVTDNPALQPDTRTVGPTPVILAATAPYLDPAGAPPSFDLMDPERTGDINAQSGAWLGTQPITFTYQWQRCTGATSDTCTDITGATDAKYVPTLLDVGLQLLAKVYATNDGGTTMEPTPLTNVVGDGRIPANTIVPTISGPGTVGQTNTADPGTWTGTGTITYSYQWQRCNSFGAGCQDIPGESAVTYDSRAADQGGTIVVLVTGHSLRGVSAPVASAPLAIS